MATVENFAPSGLCSDADFLRRVYLDLTGLPPSAEGVEKFLADKRDTRAKRAELVDALVGSERVHRSLGQQVGGLCCR